MKEELFYVVGFDSFGKRINLTEDHDLAYDSHNVAIPESEALELAASWTPGTPQFEREWEFTAPEDRPTRPAILLPALVE